MSEGVDLLAALREELASRTGTDPADWYPSFRVRHAMQVVLSVLREMEGDGAVLTQLLTCCTAVDPIIQAGLVPAYGDIDQDSLALDPASVAGVDNLRAVVLQHTFGLFDHDGDLALGDAAHRAGALLLEDCAHCACHMAMAGDTPLADISFHSFGVQKMAATDFGALTWVNPHMANADLHDVVVAALRALPQLDGRLDRSVRSYGLQIRVLMHLPAPVRRALWNQLARWRVFVPSVSDEERRGKVSYTPSLPGDWVADHMLDGIADLPRQEERSLEATRIFLQELSPLADAGLLFLPGAARARELPLLRFPVVLESAERADALVKAIGDAGCYCDTWGRPALYPGALDPGAYGLSPDGDLSAWPTTKRMVEGVVPLYTSVPVEEAHLVSQTVASFLKTS